MLGAEWLLAFMKTCIEIAFAIVGAIPLYFSWNCIAANYLALTPWFPVAMIHLPFWHVVAFLIASIYLGQIINRLTPKFVQIEQSNKAG